MVFSYGTDGWCLEDNAVEYIKFRSPYVQDNLPVVILVSYFKVYLPVVIGGVFGHYLQGFRTVFQERDFEKPFIVLVHHFSESAQEWGRVSWFDGVSFLVVRRNLAACHRYKCLVDRQNIPVGSGKDYFNAVSVSFHVKAGGKMIIVMEIVYKYVAVAGTE